MFNNMIGQNLSEGRAGVVWEPSNNKMLFLLLRNKMSVTSSPYFIFASTLLLSFLTPSVVFQRINVHLDSYTKIKLCETWMCF
jgi:hypothetical protein